MKSQSVRQVEVAGLQFGFSPRTEAHDEIYVRTLAERFDDLPPIVVHGDELTVIDGVHRVLAARHIGREQINATVFEGTDEEAGVEAVRLNVVHGKPLTLGERAGSASRFLTSHPDWSDRRVAAICGLSPKTVGRLRHRVLVDAQKPASRTGKDGRARPTDPAVVRRRVADLLSAAPESSARQIAAAAGTSQATVLDVRRRLERGDPAAPPGRPAGAQSQWRDDAALSATSGACHFTQWFERTAIGDTDTYVAAVPLSRVYLVVDECRRRAREWENFASALEQRARRSVSNAAGLVEAQ